MILTKSKIAWTDEVWNPCTGCTPISEGCQNCYARPLALRWQRANPRGKFRRGFQFTVHNDPKYMNIPLNRKKPTIYFVNSMSDLFHRDAPVAFIQRVFQIMNTASQHTFLVLTKRAERMLELSPALSFTDNIWMGVSIEKERYIKRLEYLRATPAQHRFISFEPLLEPIPLIDLSEIHWVITGGESGVNARPFDPEWAVQIRNEAIGLRIPFFHKQNGGTVKCSHCGEWGCCLLNGQLIQQTPQGITGGSNIKHLPTTTLNKFFS